MIAYNEDEAAVLRLHEEVVDAFNKPDLNKLLSLHTDNVVIMEAGMPAITGKAEVAKLFEKFQQQEIVLKLSFNIQEIEVFDKRAFVRGQVIKQTVYNDQAPEYETGKFITLSQKQSDGRWLRTHVISNSDGASK